MAESIAPNEPNDSAESIAPNEPNDSAESIAPNEPDDLGESIAPDEPNLEVPVYCDELFIFARILCHRD